MSRCDSVNNNNNNNSAQQHAHLGTLRKLYDLRKQVHEESTRQQQVCQQQLQDLTRKLQGLAEKCADSTTQLQAAKVALDDAEKNLDVIDVDSDDTDQKQRTRTWSSRNVNKEMEVLDDEEEEKDQAKSAAVVELPKPVKKRRLGSTSTAAPATATATCIPLRKSMGRTRERLNKSRDVVSLLQGSKFAQCCLGTKSLNGRTQITFLVLNDEMNEFVSSQKELQEFYLGTGSSKKKFGIALRKQEEAFPFFHAPKKRKTNDIYYVGHWKQIKSEALEPPHNFMGCPRQMRFVLEFVRYDEMLDKAIAAC
jgi:hypothetical protein